MTGMTRILLLAQIFFLVSNFFTGILQVHQIFIVPALSPIVYNLFIILSIFTLTPTFGIYGVAYGAVVGAFFHLAIQVPLLQKLGYKYRPTFDLKMDGVKEIVRLMRPRSLSLGLDEIESTVIVSFASSLTAGSISILTLALQLMYLPSRIFATTIGQASLPMLSKNIARNEMDQFRNTVRKTITQSLFLAIPITTLVLVHRIAIVRIAFGARQFPWAATLTTARVLAFLTPAIICQAVTQILIRSFYALHDTKTPLKISAVSLVADILLCYLLITFTSLGISGLALSDSLGNIIEITWLFYIFIKRVDGVGWGKTYFHVFKIVIASIILGFASWGSLRVLDIFVFDSTKTLSLIIITSIACISGLIAYAFTAKILQIEEFQDYQRYFLKIKSFFFH